MASDLRFALRMLIRNPGFAAIAILTLALGIGANTAMFTVFHGILLKPLSYPEPERLVAIEEVVPKFSRFGPAIPVTAWHFREWRKTAHSFEGLALIGDLSLTLTSGGDPMRVTAARVSASIFPLLGIHAARGRTFLEEEDQRGHDLVVVISDRLWSGRFHRNPGIVGSKIVLQGVPFEVVGVLPPDAHIPSQGRLQSMAMSNGEADIYKPFAVEDSDLAILAEFNFGCLGRLKRGVTIAQATADLNSIQKAIVDTMPEKTELRARISGLQEQMTGSSRTSITLLMAAAGAVLLIVIVNLANLLLARGAGRRRELAIRAAIGAGTGRLVRQLLVESLLLTAIGGVAGALAGSWALIAIRLKAPLDVAGIRDLQMDGATLAFAAMVSIASGVLFGALPAWRMAQTDPQSALKAAGASATESRGGGRARGFLITAEVALTVLCLVAGGLLLNSFVRLTHVDKGFQADRAIAINLGLPGGRYRDSASRVRFVRSLLDRVQAIPGVVAAGISNRGPLSGEGSNLSIEVEGVNIPSVERPTVDYRCVTPDFLRAMGIPLVDGRAIADSDDSRPVALVSQSAARRLWPDQNPIGRRFRLGADFWIEVVGVTGDVRHTLSKAPNPTVYIPFRQRDRADFSLVVRSATDPRTVAPPVRATIHGLDPQLVIPQAQTLGEVVDASVRQRRFQLSLVLGFAAAALLLAAIGVYGVVSQSVTLRTREIGIRLALGASRGNLWRVVAQHGMTPVAVGLFVGIAAALAASKFLGSLLFGIPATDLATYAEVTGVLLGAACLACYLPARRAMRVDPLVALRHD
jgi:putative ABC transport system permease protein